ncbi:pseudouridine synthase [Chloroflexota bacterium]
MPTKPLLKALTEAVAGSRRRMADAIRKGMVEINGAIAEDFNHPVNIATDNILINGQQADLKPRQVVCLMLNKPRGILSTTSDSRGRQTVLNILPREYRHLRLYPAGRLDKDSTGLLLLTNDGKLTYQLTHPRFEHEKEYLVHIDAILTPEKKRKLEQGIKLDDGMTYPSVVKKVASLPSFNYSITIHEGRKRQVHRMFAHLGYRVLSLKRVRIGKLTLDNLKEGEIRQLSAQDIAVLFSNTA